MRIVTIVGARPQFVKLAPVSRAIAAAGASGAASLEDIIVHTGQHYDPGLSDVFFEELEIPRPAVHLGIGSGGHGAQTGRMLDAIESVLLDKRPDMVVIYGDTNSTLAGALAASKLHIPIAHIEAGLRSFDRRMPEEVNRIVSDHVSDLLFAPTRTAMENLAAENLAERSELVGDVMLDAVRFNADIARQRSTILAALGIEDLPFGIVTLHRAGNTDTERLAELLEALNEASDRLTLVFPAHPRTVGRIKSDFADWRPAAALRMIDPVGYLDMLRLLESASVVVTDSGGLQKEAFFLGVPCVTLRNETEWPETVEAGANTLVGADRQRILSALDCALEAAPGGAASGAAEQYFGDGRAADAIVSHITRYPGRR